MKQKNKAEANKLPTCIIFSCVIVDFVLFGFGILS
jgi:hypothetical protein